MKNFYRIAQGVDVMPLMLAISFKRKQAQQRQLLHTSKLVD